MEPAIRGGNHADAVWVGHGMSGCPVPAVVADDWRFFSVAKERTLAQQTTEDAASFETHTMAMWNESDERF